MSTIGKHQRGAPVENAAASTITNILSWVVLALGTATAGFTVFLVIRSFSPVLYVDQWSIVNHLLLNAKVSSLQWFWTQHNEHRLPIVKALELMDLYWFGGHNVLVITLSMCVVTAHVLFLAYLVRRLGALPIPATRFLAGAAAFCLFCPNQWETFVFAFAFNMVMAYSCASVAIGCLILHWKRKKEGRKDADRLVALAIAAAFLAECSVAGTLLLWPALSIGAWMLRLSRGVQIALGCAGALAIAVFLPGWESLPGQPKPWTALARPLDVAHYVVLFFGTSWRQVHGALTGYMGALGVILMAAFCAWAVIRRPVQPLLIFCALMGGFLLSTAFLTSLGRLGFGLDQASASRYQTPAMLFWWTLLAAAVALWVRIDRPERLIPVAAFAAGAMLMAMTGFTTILDLCMGRQALLETGRMAIQLNVRDDEYISVLFPDPALPFKGYHFLWQQGLSLAGPDPLRNMGQQLISSYKVRPRDSCMGTVDSKSAIGGVEVATGWAWDRATRRGPVGILFADSAGIIVGAGVAGLPRPDVRAARPEVEATNVGWHGFMRLGDGSLDIHAFAILPDGRSVCDLGVVRSGTAARQSGINPASGSVASTYGRAFSNSSSQTSTSERESGLRRVACNETLLHESRNLGHRVRLKALLECQSPARLGGAPAGHRACIIEIRSTGHGKEARGANQTCDSESRSVSGATSSFQLSLRARSARQSAFVPGPDCAKAPRRTGRDVRGRHPW